MNCIITQNSTIICSLYIYSAIYVRVDLKSIFMYLTS